MQISYLPALVMLIAGAVGCIFSIVRSYDLMYTMKMELIVMIVFFVIGQIAKKIISKVMQNDEKVEEVPKTEEINNDSDNE